jgi:hypothetical protein
VRDATRRGSAAWAAVLDRLHHRQTKATMSAAATAADDGGLTVPPSSPQPHAGGGGGAATAGAFGTSCCTPVEFDDSFLANFDVDAAVRRHSDRLPQPPAAAAPSLAAAGQRCATASAHHVSEEVMESRYARVPASIRGQLLAHQVPLGCWTACGVRCRAAGQPSSQPARQLPPTAAGGE